MQEAFDNYAVNYDEHFTFSSIGKIQRNQVYKQLNTLINFNNNNVLEINCGTGEDAIWMVKKNAKVIATDISAGMINAALEKAVAKKIVIQFKQLDTRNISSLNAGNFDFIFSNFGGLNCLNISDFKKFAKDCSMLQVKKSKVALVIMSKGCLWERLYYSFKGDKLNALRRTNIDGFETVINSKRFYTYYYSPNQIVDLFKEHYSVANIKSIGLFVPPSYLEHYFSKKKWLLNILNFFDSLFSVFSVFANYADHYLIILEKKID